jgi:hypothetical protein
MNDTSDNIESFEDAQRPPIDFAKLKSEMPTRKVEIEKTGIRTWAGKMEKLVFTSTFKEVGEKFNWQKLLKRTDYDTDSTQTGNRDIDEKHWKAIQEFIETDDRPYLGMAVVAMPPDEKELEVHMELDEFADLATVRIRSGAPRPTILDWQHRNKAACAAWQAIRSIDLDSASEDQVELYNKLLKSSIAVEMLFEDDKNLLSTLFVNLGRSKPISKDLIAVMDRSQIQNRLGADVAEKSGLFRHRITYLGAKAGRELAEKHGRDYENLYSAGNVVDAAAIVAGVGVRDRSPKQREDLLEKIVQEKRNARGLTKTDAIDAVGTEVAALFDYAYANLPGWEEIKDGNLTVEKFKDTYVHSTAAGLKVISIVLAAAKAAGVSPQRVIDVMAKEVPWRRDALRDGEDEDGNFAEVHEFFQGTLVKTTYDEKAEKWKAVTAGARRDLYQLAAEKVLKQVAAKDPSLKPIIGLPTYQAIGLAPSAGRGRPKKASAA